MNRSGSNRDARHPGARRAIAEDPARESLLALRWQGFRAFAARQPLSFWGVSLYLFFEYVRPQSIYPSLAVVPWQQIIILGTAAVCLIEGYRFTSDNPADRLLLLFTGVLLASCLGAYSRAWSFDQVKVFLTWVIVYFLISRVIDREERLLVFILCLLLWYTKMSQHADRSWAADGFQFRNWGAYGGPGWFKNSGEFGIAMTMYMPLAVYVFWGLRKRLDLPRKLILLAMPASAAVGMAASSSRGALLGGAGVAMWIVLTSRQRYKMAAVMIPMVIVAAAMIPPQQIARLHAMGTDNTSVERLTLWGYGIQITLNHPLLGIGYNNWIPYVERFYPPPHDLLPHNIFIQASSELGFTGLIAFVALIVVTFVMNLRTRRMAASLPDGSFLLNTAFGLDGALIGFLISGFFVTVLYYPFFWINLALTSALYRTTRRHVRAERTRVLRARARRRKTAPAVMAPGVPKGFGLERQERTLI